MDDEFQQWDWQDDPRPYSKTPRFESRKDVEALCDRIQEQVQASWTGSFRQGILLTYLVLKARRAGINEVGFGTTDLRNLNKQMMERAPGRWTPLSRTAAQNMLARLCEGAGAPWVRRTTKPKARVNRERQRYEKAKGRKARYWYQLREMH